MKTECSHRIVGLDRKGDGVVPSPSCDRDQSNVLPSSPEIGTGTILRGRAISFNRGDPLAPISSDQLRLINPMGGLDLFMVKCSVSRQSVRHSNPSTCTVDAYSTRLHLDQHSHLG